MSHARMINHLEKNIHKRRIAIGQYLNKIEKYDKFIEKHRQEYKEKKSLHDIVNKKIDEVMVILFEVNFQIVEKPDSDSQDKIKVLEVEIRKLLHHKRRIEFDMQLYRDELEKLNIVIDEIKEKIWILEFENNFDAGKLIDLQKSSDISKLGEIYLAFLHRHFKTKMHKKIPIKPFKKLQDITEIDT